jgi:hypothetical protein
MAHSYYSQRKGTNPNQSGLPLDDIVDLYIRVYEQLSADGYFAEAFGFECVDAGHVAGNVRDIELEVLLAVRKKDLWPPHFHGSATRKTTFLTSSSFCFSMFRSLSMVPFTTTQNVACIGRRSTSNKGKANIATK